MCAKSLVWLVPTQWKGSGCTPATDFGSDLSSSWVWGESPCPLHPGRSQKKILKESESAKSSHYSAVPRAPSHWAEKLSCSHRKQNTAATKDVGSIWRDERGVFISADECSQLRLKREAEQEEAVLWCCLRCFVPHSLEILKEFKNRFMVFCTYSRIFGLQTGIRNPQAEWNGEFP